MIEESTDTRSGGGQREMKIRDDAPDETTEGGATGVSSDDSRERPTTIDSLALKRARLPLQLLPIDLENDSDWKPPDPATRRQSFKVSRTERRRRRGGRRSRSRHGRSATAERVERAILERVAARGSGSRRNSMERSSAERETYDDVEAAAAPSCCAPGEGRSLDCSLQEDEDYDDVGPPAVRDDEYGIYDDVGEAVVTGREDDRSASDNDYSSIDEDETYDDVGGPETSDERVNSIYDGSELDSDLSGHGSHRYELDAEETTKMRTCHERNDRVASVLSASSARLRNVVSDESKDTRILVGRERRRSRGFRRSRPRGDALPPGADTVAVRIGTGSILLVGTSDGYDTWEVSESSPTAGLVQLRIIERRSNEDGEDEPIDTQETSCYVLEDTASNDSNYETLFSSFPSDEFSSDTEDEISLGSARPVQDPPPVSPIPSRPIPPPPRESSLTETFGRRIKMLRRTWSITKGSLGRMRRRTSTSTLEEANRGDASSPERPNDARKYFSFKKRFGKRGLTGLSKFYLDTAAAAAAAATTTQPLSSPSERDAYGDSSIDGYANTEYGWRINRHDDCYGEALDEQELYQFYAAAAARISFESDSEGYEEVGDPTSSEPELAQSDGRKSLWCQTSRVKSSGLLQRLAPDEKKCQEAKFEILTSETSYLNSLRVLVDEFLNNHHLVHEILTPSERERLFGGVPGVLRASEGLLTELEAVWREDPMLPGFAELLSNYARTSSSAYIAYCSNQVSIDATLKELRNRRGSKFVEAITRIESRPACQSLSLHSFLMLPMQRVTRLPLLADAVLSKLSSDSREERRSWEGALSELSRVVIECNEGARAAGRLAETEALERKLEYCSKVRPIELKDRYLIRRGPVVRLLAKSDADYRLTFGKKYHKTRLCLFLLTDHLLIAKPKTSANEETYTVIDGCKRNLLELESVEEDSPFAGRNAMLLTLLENHLGRQVEYILACENPTERERWLDAVSPPKPSLVGESLYETWDCPQAMVLYPYAAAQPDELSVQPGEVINVLRKMSDGWHLGEKLLGGEQGWFPGNYAKEVASEHVRAKNLRLRHRLLALSTSVLQQRTKHALR